LSPSELTLHSYLWSQDRSSVTYIKKLLNVMKLIMLLAIQKLAFLIVHFTNSRCHISVPFLLYQSIEHAEQKVASTLLLVTYSSTMNMNHHVPLKCLQLSIRLHGIRSHKTPVFSLLLCFATTYAIFISKVHGLKS